MLDILQPYISPILNACLLFPPVAGLFTLPWLISHYRRYGGVAIMRTLVVYSFILYSMCALFLTVLPLPAIDEVRKMSSHPFQWIPFYNTFEMFKDAGFSIKDFGTFFQLSRYRQVFTSHMFFQLMANIVMQIPLGFYLRYYFRRSWKQTLIIGFAVSMFYEMVQLSGLFFIYPKPYRYSEMDDLICNTAGAMIGFWIAPLLMKILPSREELDETSYAKGKRLTLTRRLFAATLDWLLYLLVFNLFSTVPSKEATWFSGIGNSLFYILWVFLYFVLLQWLTHGKTLGKFLLKIQVVSTDGPSRPSLKQLLVRYSFIYLIIFPVFILVGSIMALIGISSIVAASDQRVGIIVLFCIVFILSLIIITRSYYKWGNLPHAHFSKTKIVLSNRMEKKNK